MTTATCGAEADDFFGMRKTTRAREGGCKVDRMRAEHGDAIILIGFMGAGKSCAGAELCRRVPLPVFDTDAMIVSKREMPVAEIFAKLGEATFRDDETEALRAIPAGEALVITGGGCILREENVELMQRLGRLVWLRAEKETIFERIAHREDRPLLRGHDPHARIAHFMEVREPLYRAAADHVIQTDALTPAEVAEAILLALGIEVPLVADDE